MTFDAHALEVLRQAVADAPADVALRLRLAGALLEAGQAQDAWHHCTRILHEHPDHVETLRLAQKAAAAAGVSNRAEEYAATLASLAGEGGKRVSGEKQFHVRGVSLRLIQGGAGRDEADDERPDTAFRPGEKR